MFKISLSLYTCTFYLLYFIVIKYTFIFDWVFSLWFAVKETSICLIPGPGTMIWYFLTMPCDWWGWTRVCRTIEITWVRTLSTRWKTCTGTPVYQSNPAPHHTLPSLFYYWQPYSYSRWLFNICWWLQQSDNHFHGWKLWWKCLSDMYLYLYVYHCHYYCLIVRIF